MSILRNKHNGWTWNMERHFNKGGFNPIEIISDAVSSVGDFFADIDPGPAIGQAGSEIDTFVNREIPGGWVAPAAVAVAVTTGYFDPSLLAAEGATGTGFVGLDAATATELGLSGGSGLGTTGASGNVLAGIYGADATLGSGFAGVSPELAAELGLSGTSGLGIEGASGDVLAGIPTGSTSVIDVLNAANRARTLANMLQGGQQISMNQPNMGINQPNMGMPEFEQFGGLYRSNQLPFLTTQSPITQPLQKTQNFLTELSEQGKPTDLASLLRNV